MNHDLIDCIGWLLNITKERVDKVPNKAYLCNQLLNDLEKIEKEIDVYKDNFYNLVNVKNSLRCTYRQIVKLYTDCLWQAPGYSYNDNIKYSSNFQTDLYKYNRVHDSPILKNVKEQFEKQFHSDSDNTISFITNSGMSAMELGFMTCNYMRIKGAILIQDNQYYEVGYLANALFTTYELLKTNEIYKYILSDTIIGCIVVGYLPFMNKDNNFDLEYFLECLSKHRQTQNMIIIFDRTYFSLIDNLPQKLQEYNLGKNIIFISIESLNKNHQYGLDMTNLGYCRIYSKMTPILSGMGFIDKIYSAGTMRPENSALMELYPFKKEILVKRYLWMCHNTELIVSSLNHAGYNTINVRYKINPNKEVLGNIIFIMFSIDYRINEKRLINSLRDKKHIIMGTSFGFDVTRVEYIDKKKGEVMLRISVGTEPEHILKNVINDILTIVKEATNIEHEEGLL